MRCLRPLVTSSVVAALAISIALSGCGDGRPAAAVPTSLPAVTDRAPAVGGDPARAAVTVASVAAPTGAFCRAWLHYATTVRLLVALTLDSSPNGTRHLVEVELLSAASMEESVGAIGAHWPSELVGERSAVLVDVVGPYLRRAQKALAVLAVAGLSAADVADLRLVWRDVLAAAERWPDAGTGAWLERALVPAHLRDPVAGAAAAFDASVTGFGDDPTLPERTRLVDASTTPRTDAFLAARCPAAAAVGSGLEF